MSFSSTHESKVKARCFVTSKHLLQCC